MKRTSEVDLRIELTVIDGSTGKAKLDVEPTIPVGENELVLMPLKGSGFGFDTLAVVGPTILLFDRPRLMALGPSTIDTRSEELIKLIRFWALAVETRRSAAAAMQAARRKRRGVKFISEFLVTKMKKPGGLTKYRYS